MRPASINILGNTYSVTYVDNPAEVDWRKREALWGQIDYWTRGIRVYEKDRTSQDVLHTLIHEILHGIVSALHIDDEKVDDETTIDVLALALADVLTRNGWLKEGE